MRRWDFGAFLQVRNALGHRNDVTYSDTVLFCVARSPSDPTCVEEPSQDYFKKGLPTLPVVGLRARF
jgi:hypothetical protein